MDFIELSSHSASRTQHTPAPERPGRSARTPLDPRERRVTHENVPLADDLDGYPAISRAGRQRDSPRLLPRRPRTGAPSPTPTTGTPLGPARKTDTNKHTDAGTRTRTNTARADAPDVIARTSLENPHGRDPDPGGRDDEPAIRNTPPTSDQHEPDQHEPNRSMPSPTRTLSLSHQITGDVPGRSPPRSAMAAAGPILVETCTSHSKVQGGVRWWLHR